MKCHEQITARMAEATVKLDKIKCEEYNVHIDGDGAVACYVEIEDNKQVIITGRYEGPPAPVCFDLIIDGILRNTSRFSPNPERSAGQKRAMKKQFNFEKAFKVMDKGFCECNMYTRLIDDAPEPIQLDTPTETVGTIEVRISAQDQDETQAFHVLTDVKKYVTNWQENQPKPNYKLIPPQHEINVFADEEPKEVAKGTAQRLRKEAKVKRPGYQPFAIMRFYYRTKDEILAAGLKPNTKGGLSFALNHRPTPNGTPSAPSAQTTKEMEPVKANTAKSRGSTNKSAKAKPVVLPLTPITTSSEVDTTSVQAKKKRPSTPTPSDSYETETDEEALQYKIGSPKVGSDKIGSAKIGSDKIGMGPKVSGFPPTFVKSPAKKKGWKRTVFGDLKKHGGTLNSLSPVVSKLKDMQVEGTVTKNTNATITATTEIEQIQALIQNDAATAANATMDCRSPSPQHHLDLTREDRKKSLEQLSQDAEKYKDLAQLMSKTRKFNQGNVERQNATATGKLTSLDGEYDQGAGPKTTGYRPDIPSIEGQSFNEESMQPVANASGFFSVRQGDGPITSHAINSISSKSAADADADDDPEMSNGQYIPTPYAALVPLDLVDISFNEAPPAAPSTLQPTEAQETGNDRAEITNGLEVSAETAENESSARVLPSYHCKTINAQVTSPQRLGKFIADSSNPATGTSSGRSPSKRPLPDAVITPTPSKRPRIIDLTADESLLGQRRRQLEQKRAKREEALRQAKEIKELLAKREELRKQIEEVELKITEEDKLVEEAEEGLKRAAEEAAAAGLEAMTATEDGTD